MQARAVLLLSLIFLTRMSYAQITSGGRTSKIELSAGTKFTLNRALDFSGSLVSTGEATELAGANVVSGTDLYCRLGEAEFTLTGTYDGASSPEKILLVGSDTLRAHRAVNLPEIRVSGTGNRLEGAVKLSAPIYLSPGTTSLRLALDTTLNDSLVLNGQTVTLEKDLFLDISAGVTSDGIITGDGGAFILPSDSTWSSTLTFNGSTVIELAGDVSLSGMWHFAQADGISVFHGNGHVLDLSLGGTLWLTQGHGCLFENVIIKGLGEGFGHILHEDELATASWVGSTIGLVQNFTLTTGQWYFSGVDNRLVTGSKLFTSKVDAKVTVDQGRLTCDTLSKSGGLGVTPAAHDGVNLFLINNGRLSSPTQTEIENHLFVDDVTYQQSKNLELNDSLHLVFRGDNAQVMTFDGNGYFLSMPRDSQTYISAFSGKKVVFTNTCFKDFLPTSINRGSAEWVFGDGTCFEYAPGGRIDLSTTFTCTGSVLFDLQGSDLSISALDGIVGLAGATITVADGVLHNIQSYGSYSASIHSVDPSAKIIFEQARLMLDSDYTLSIGLYEFSSDVVVAGSGNSLIYTSTSPVTIQAKSSLTLERGVTFSYDSQSGSKTSLVMSDASSTLALNDASLISTATGVRLSTGRLIVDGVVTFSGSASNFAEGIEISSSLDGYCRPGSTLNLSTYVVYV